MEQRRGYPPPRIMRVSDLKAKNSSILSRVFRLQLLGPGPEQPAQSKRRDGRTSGAGKSKVQVTDVSGCNGERALQAGRTPFIVLLGCCVATLVGCATYHDDLVRGQHYYDLNQYNDALAVWRILEIDWDSLTYPEQARYSYLRGMTDYRMGFRADARHWLSISQAVEQKHPGGLDAQANAQLNQVLTELNTAVYAMGPPPSAVATGVELPNVTANLELPPSAPAQATQSPAPATPATSNAPATNSTAPAAPAPTATP